MIKKICIVTGSRADYGIFYPLLKAIKKDSNFKLQIICTNMHLSKKYGSTYKEIIKDGFTISQKIPLETKNNNIHEQVLSTSILIKKFSLCINKLKPDLIILLGDRFETFASAYVAMINGIPIAHIHGGELSLGVIDERMRHAITKMSDFHFTSTLTYKKRLTQMGEVSKNIFNVGSLSVERIKNMKLLDKKQFERKINFKLGEKSILFTYHPTEKKIEDEKKNIKKIFNALEKIKDYKIIFTLPNSDPFSDCITKSIIKFKNMNSSRSKIFKSMTQNLYYSAMKNCNLIIGNSSSGIIEAPSLNRNIINIGDRQEGRIQSKNIVNCSLETNLILKTINNINKNKKKKYKNPYYKTDTCKEFVRILKKIKLSKKMKKKFYDIKF